MDGAAANRAFRVLRAICNFARARYESADGEPLLPANPVERLTQTRAWFKQVRRQTIVKVEQHPAWFAAVAALGGRGDTVPQCATTSSCSSSRACAARRRRGCAGPT
jgi:hypothetical protein